MNAEEICLSAASSNRGVGFILAHGDDHTECDGAVVIWAALVLQLTGGLLCALAVAPVAAAVEWRVTFYSRHSTRQSLGC